MKRFIYTITVLVIAAVCMLPGLVVAQTATAEEYLSHIAQRCEGTKQLIDQQRRNDLVARINKGRAYQTLIDQQSAFLQRMRNNRMSSDVFDKQAVEIQKGVNQFRAAYYRYDDAVADLLNIDCATKPMEFSQQLVLARSLRIIIGNETEAVDAAINNYRQSVIDLKNEMQRLGNAAGTAL